MEAVARGVGRGLSVGVGKKGPARECRKMLQSLPKTMKCPVGRAGSRGCTGGMTAKEGLVVDGSAHVRHELAI
jgi:hypothetical protein